MGIKGLKKAIETVDPAVEDGEVLRITLMREEWEHDYTYAAVFVAHRWWLTGTGALLDTVYSSTLELLSALAAGQFEYTVEHAAAFEAVR